MEIKKFILSLFLVFVLVFSSGCLQSFRNPNPELCEKVSHLQNRDNCYHQVALAKGDDVLCSKIIDVNERDNCYMNLAVGRTRYFVD